MTIVREARRINRTVAMHDGNYGNDALACKGGLVLRSVDEDVPANNVTYVISTFESLNGQPQNVQAGVIECAIRPTTSGADNESASVTVGASAVVTTSWNALLASLPAADLDRIDVSEFPNISNIGILANGRTITVGSSGDSYYMFPVFNATTEDIDDLDNYIVCYTPDISQT